MNDHIKKYILPKLQKRYSWLTKHIIEIHEQGDGFYILEMDDGECMLYDELVNDITSINDDTDPTKMNEPEWREYFASRLRRKLRFLNMTQKELAEKAGISIVAVHKYTKGMQVPNLFYIHKLAVALDCSITDLTGFK